MCSVIDPQEHVDAIGNAADFVRRNAEELRSANTLVSDSDDWMGDADTKALYELEIAAADDADDAAEAFIALQGERDALLLALIGLVEEKQPLGIERETYQHALKLIVAIEEREDACHTTC